MCCRSEWQERMYIYKWHEVDQTKHEIFCVHIVCNEIQVKVNLEITTFFFYLRFPYCPNFFWFGCTIGMCISITETNAIHISMYSQRYDTFKIHTYEVATDAVRYLLRCSVSQFRFDSTQCDSMQYNAMGKKNMLFNSIWYTGLQTATKTVLKRKNINLRVKILLKSPLATIYMYMLWLKNLHVMPFFLIVLLSHLLLCSRIKLRRCASKF